MGSKTTIVFLDELKKRLIYARNHGLSHPVLDTDILNTMREIVDIQLALVNYLNSPLPSFVTDFQPYFGDGIHPVEEIK